MRNMATKDVLARVRQLLLREWDPIGIADEPAAQDEYDGYVGQIAQSVFAHLPASEIANRLIIIETELVRLPGDRARAVRVADRLSRLLPR